VAEESVFGMIYDHYKKRILSGEMKPGDEFPSRRRICDDEKLGYPARNTVDKAVWRLAHEGYVELRPAPKQAVVADIAARHASTFDRVTAAKVTGRALSPGETSKIVSVGMVLCPVDVSLKMQVEPGAAVLERTRVHYMKGSPISMSTSWYPPFVAESTPELSVPESLPGGSRELACRNLAVEPDYLIQESHGRMPDGAERAHLALAPNQWVTETLRTVFVTDGRIIEVAKKITEIHKPVRAKISLR
jgi:DNA-binding GntR family transcriptional regulator